eukprot:5819043-Amphidinium_carterae.1
MRRLAEDMHCPGGSSDIGNPTRVTKALSLTYFGAVHIKPLGPVGRTLLSTVLLIILYTILHVVEVQVDDANCLQVAVHFGEMIAVVQ